MPTENVTCIAMSWPDVVSELIVLSHHCAPHSTSTPGITSGFGPTMS